MSFALVGGILLIVGAFLTMLGRINYSILIYFAADICWVAISMNTGDMLGAFLVFVGMTLGIIAYWRMQTGKMRKTLKYEDE